MENLKKIVKNEYFPAGAVLTAVVLFWLVGSLGGLSLLNNNQPPLTTLTWMLFVYTAAVLTPLAGLLAAADLLRRWRRNRAAAAVAGTHGTAVQAPVHAPAAAAAGRQPQGRPGQDQSPASSPLPAGNAPGGKKPKQRGGKAA